MSKENTLIILDAEINQTKIRLLDQIKSMQNTLDVLRFNVENGIELNESQGLQGNGGYLDLCLSKFIMYEKFIDRVKNI